MLSATRRMREIAQASRKQEGRRKEKQRKSGIAQLSVLRIEHTASQNTRNPSDLRRPGCLAAANAPSTN